MFVCYCDPFEMLYSSFPYLTCHVSLLSHDLCNLHNLCSPRMPQSSFYSPSPQLHVAMLLSFSREVPEQSCCVFSEREGVIFVRGIIHQEICAASALYVPCHPVPGTFANFFLLTRILRLVGERKKVASYRTDPAFCGG